MIAVDADNHGQRFPEEFGFLCDMRKSESAEGSALSADDKHLLADGYSANHIFALFGVIELVHVVNGIDVGLLLNKPAYFPA